MKNNDQEIMELRFPKLNHFWFDSGILGLYRTATNIVNSENAGVKISIASNGIIFEGAMSSIHKLLEEAYWSLLYKHYNRSNTNQIQRNEGFYFDSGANSFCRFPKVESTPIAKLLRPKYAQPLDDLSSVKYEDAKKYKLPEGHESLQKELDAFLDEIEKREGKKLPPTGSKLLVNGKNAYQPKVEIQSLFKAAKTKGKNCFICGDDKIKLVNSSGLFPFLSGPDGSLSFNTLGSSPQDVCCKCAFVGKFVPVNGFYWCNTKPRNEIDMRLFFPYSSDLTKMNSVYGAFHAAEFDDPNLFRNFEHELGGYFQRPYELTFAFLHTIYVKTLKDKKTDSETEDENATVEFDYTKLYDLTLSTASLEFMVIATESLGDTQMGKMIWPFQDSVYFFRLMNSMENSGIRLKDVMRKFVDVEQSKNENKTLVRNRVCERILKKQSILDLVEQHVFHMCKSKNENISQINEFLLHYEAILKEGGKGMDQTGVDAAVKLGKRIGNIIAKAENGKKGDLFALRKTRKIEDFLNEVNRVQFKYNISVPTEIYDGYLNRETFGEFKQFCMIAALNAFNGTKYHSEIKGGENS